MKNLSYCAELVLKEDHDGFLAALFVPAPEREALLALAALNVELAHVREAVHEEMIGHIRYAWWQETIEAMYRGQPRQGQPVLEALMPLVTSGQLPQDALMALVTRYRDAFPDAPQGVDTVMEELLAALLMPKAAANWRRARGKIVCHRQRYGKGWNGWLAIKLLIGR
ncbi:MAG: squalene/phytoene synthase family protein [Pseudomonadota bacterium]|nr:squalene/phytoene synthase family protein [Pseudomonadota bacterium]